MLRYEKKQKPIVAQIFGGKPENYKKAARLVKKKGFCGVDINMGCPQKNILKQISGSELINYKDLTKEIIKNTRKGAGGIPLSIKTRIGYNKIDLSWIEFLLSFKPESLAVHLRTKKEMSKVKAHWELAQDVVELKNKISPDTVLLLNGDIESRREAVEKIKESGADGVLIGRGIFKNPFLFNKNISWESVTVEEKINITLRHLKYFEDEFGETKYNLNKFGKRIKSFSLFKKFLKIYINDFRGSKELRIKLMETKNKQELKEVINTFIK